MSKPSPVNENKFSGKNQKKAQFKRINGFHSNEWSPLIFLILTAIIVFYTRLRLLAIPLERDEGGFAYIGHWLWRGKDLYTDMLDSKLPGLYGVYALSTNLFGYNATGVHIGLMLCNAIAAYFFFRLLNKLYNFYVACTATSFFIILTASINVLGFAAHATQLLLPFVLAGIFLFWKAIEKRKLVLFFLAGLLIGIAFTIKQQAAIFGILLAGVWWLIRLQDHKNQFEKNRIWEWILLGIGGLLPLVIILAYYSITQRLEDFILWTVEQPMMLSGAFTDPWYKSFSQGILQVTSGFEIIWLVSLCGMFLFWFSGFRRHHNLFGILFSIAGLLSVAIGVGYYRHYFVLAMPGIALCCAVASYWIAMKAGRHGNAIGLLFALIIMGIPIIMRADYFFTPDFTKIHQEVYNENMFPEIEKLGQQLATRIPEGSKIAVLGSEPELLVAAQREGCTKYLMVYSILLDPQRANQMQDEYFNDITTCDADYVVFDVFSSSWTPGFESLPLHQRNMEWIRANFMLEGIAEYRKGLPGIILWGDEARNHQSTSNYNVYVFKRKGL